MQSLVRVLELISLIEKSKGNEYTLSELSQESDLPLSTVHRIIKVLVKYRYIYRDEIELTYHLGPRLVELGIQAKESLNIRQEALPIMRALTKSVEENSYLTIQSGYYGVYIEKVDSNQEIQLLEPLGAIFPLHAGASRKVLLAYLPESIVYEMNSQGLLKSRSSNTITEPQKLIEELKEIRRNQYSISVNENITGASSIASPIWDSKGQVIGALSIAGPSERINSQCIDELKEKVIKASYKLSKKMGWSENIKIV